jgi:hypothetical protein
LQTLQLGLHLMHVSHGSRSLGACLEPARRKPAREIKRAHAFTEDRAEAVLAATKPPVAICPMREPRALLATVAEAIAESSRCAGKGILASAGDPPALPGRQ